MRRLADELPNVLLLIVGGDSPNYDVPRLARFAGIERPGAAARLRAGWILPALFAAADVCVNLRFPTAGETSAAVLRLMSAGLPTIVTETGAFADLPDDAVLKVPPDAFEGELLTTYLRALATNEPFRRALGANARDFVRREHTMRRAAEGYLDVLSEVTGLSLDHTHVREPVRRSHEPKPEQQAQTVPAEAPMIGADALLAPVADALAEIGLTGDAALIEQTAQHLAEMRIGVPRQDQSRARRNHLKRVFRAPPQSEMRRHAEWPGRPLLSRVMVACCALPAHRQPIARRSLQPLRWLDQ